MIEPQRLQAGRGWQWIRRGWHLFMKAPLLWIVLLAICFIGAAALSALPTLGDPLTTLLLPAVLAGLMTGCRALEQGDELELAHLANGFRQHASQLIMLGGISLVGQFAILGIVMSSGGADLVGLLTSGETMHDPERVRQAMEGAGFSVLIGIALFSFLMMALQFAPMLVYFHGIAPAQALKLSLRAFLVNVGPMLVYGFTFTLLALLASMPMMLGWVVLLPLMFTSLYACYDDIFPRTAEVPDETEAA